ncbi:MAG: hypothetical protein IJT32_06760, partial [Lachnospiraceae bacterium]|nr:hypothetical protein [Lachnospiraceae bacterium]
MNDVRLKAVMDAFSSYTEFSNEEYVSEDMLRSADTPAPVLEKIYERNKNNVNVLRGLAMNANCPSGLLASLSGNENDAVRWGVADNSNTSAETLERLAGDANDVIRYRVAMNPNAKGKTLRHLAQSGNPLVRS